MLQRTFHRLVGMQNDRDGVEAAQLSTTAFLLEAGEVTVAKAYTLYCPRIGLRPNSAVVKQLPEADSLNPNFVPTLNLATTYLGNQGLRGVAMIFRLCEALGFLDVADQRLRDLEFCVMLRHLHSTPTLAVLRADNNDIGCDSAKELQRLLHSTSSLTSVSVRGTCITNAVQKQISALAATNLRKAQLQTVASSEDGRRASSVIVDLQPQPPANGLAEWASRWAEEISTVLHRHRHSMRPVFEAFQCRIGGLAGVDIGTFHAALVALGLPKPQKLDDRLAPRLVQLVGYLGCWEPEKKHVAWRVALQHLRCHATLMPLHDLDAAAAAVEESATPQEQTVEPATPFPGLYQALVDELYDRRDSLRQIFTTIDVDRSGLVTLQELRRVLLSPPHEGSALSTAQRPIAVDALLTKLGPTVDGLHHYDSILRALELQPSETANRWWAPTRRTRMRRTE
eukprot:TRINITY_DN10036_c0_g1_i1.p1 TRINITY_DN10036_c0_g1~~TRINITY_DN10036_c0_g1_i1.p1  ORF type:complete len:454 (-),score=66.85 TRINITY_DN10036_c0_g1_i1:3-1364(-)